MRKSILAVAAIAAIGLASAASTTDASAKGFGGGFKGGGMGMGKGFGGGFKGGWRHGHGRRHGYWGYGVATFTAVDCYNVITPSGFVRTICE